MALNIVGVTTSANVLQGRNGMLRGYNFAETAGVTTSAITVYSGISATGTPLFTWHFRANETIDNSWTYDEALAFTNGMYAVVTGAITGSIRWS